MSAAPSGRSSAPISATRLLRALLWIGTIGFGGGSALIPVFWRQLVDRKKALNKETFTRHTIVANITPGALPVKLAASAGIVVGRWPLALLSAFAVAAPGVIACVALLAVASSLGPTGLDLISFASVGITAFIVVLLLGYVLKVHAAGGRRLRIYVVITALSALSMGANDIAGLIGTLVGVDLAWDLPQLSAAVLIALALAIIVAVSLVPQRQPRTTVAVAPGGGSDMRKSLRATWAFVGVTVTGLAILVAVSGTTGLRFGSLLAFSTVSSFGGGEAYIGVADGYFVSTGMVDQYTFYTQLVPIANAMPGPILVKVGAGLGYLMGLPMGDATACLLALASTLITIGACCAVAMPVLGAYARLAHHPIVVNIGNYILPVICGLLIAVSATMLQVSIDVAKGAGAPAGGTLVVMAVAIALMLRSHVKGRIPDMLLLLGSGVLSTFTLLLW